MRTTIFSENEICLHGDVNTLQLDRMKDLASVLAAFDAKDVSEVPVGIEVVGVLAGCFPTATVSAPNVVIDITAGTILYRYTTASGSNYRVAQSAATQITVPLAGAGYHRSLFVEALVSEETVQLERTFRVDLSGHISEQDRLTDKYVQSRTTFRVRDGVVYGTGATPYLPAFASEASAAVLGYMTIGEATVTNVRQIRRRYRPGMGVGFSSEPIRAYCGVNKSSALHTVTQNVIGFGLVSPFDYASTEYTFGTSIPLEAGVSLVANSLYYVYAVRPSPKVGGCDLILTNKLPSNERNLGIGQTITLGGIWPAGSTVSGSEARYLYAIPTNDQGWLSGIDRYGPTTKTVGNRPSFDISTAIDPTTGVGLNLNFAGMVPPNTMTVDFSMHVQVTSGGTAINHHEVIVSGSTLNTYASYQERSMMITNGIANPNEGVKLENLHGGWQSSASKIIPVRLILGGDVTSVDITVFINGFTEVTAL